MKITHCAVPTFSIYWLFDICNVSVLIFPQNKPKVDPEALDLELFGVWQTEEYIPPPAVDVS